MFFEVQCIKRHVTVFKINSTEPIFLIALHGTKSILQAVTILVYTDSEVT